MYWAGKSRNRLAISIKKKKREINTGDRYAQEELWVVYVDIWCTVSVCLCELCLFMKNVCNFELIKINKIQKKKKDMLKKLKGIQ